MRRPSLFGTLLVLGLTTYFVVSLWLQRLQPFGDYVLWGTAGVMLGYFVRPLDDQRSRDARKGGSENLAK